MNMSITSKISTKSQLFQFWKEIKENDKASFDIFHISVEDVFEEINNDEDEELLEVALDSMEVFNEDDDWNVPRVNDRNFIKSKPAAVLTRLPNGVYMASTTNDSKDSGKVDIVKLIDDYFLVLKSSFLDGLIRSMNHADDIPPPVIYSQPNLALNFLNILTYPRRTKRFKLLLNKFTSLGLLRDIMLTEVGLRDINELELYFKGKKLRRELDSSTLSDIGLSSDNLIIISRKVGPGTSTLTDEEIARNRKFIGDLLFGFGCECGEQHEQHTNSPSIVFTLTLSHGYRLLAKILERLIKIRFSEAIHREEVARKSEEELFALLDKEDKGKLIEEEKKKKKKLKEKEKKKQKQQQKQSQSSNKSSPISSLKVSSDGSAASSPQSNHQNLSSGQSSTDKLLTSQKQPQRKGKNKATSIVNLIPSTNQPINKESKSNIDDSDEDSDDSDDVEIGFNQKEMRNKLSNYFSSLDVNAEHLSLSANVAKPTAISFSNETNNSNRHNVDSRSSKFTKIKDPKFQNGSHSNNFSKREVTSVISQNNLSTPLISKSSNFTASNNLPAANYAENTVSKVLSDLKATTAALSTARYNSPTTVNNHISANAVSATPLSKLVLKSASSYPPNTSMPNSTDSHPNTTLSNQVPPAIQTSTLVTLTKKTNNINEKSHNSLQEILQSSKSLLESQMTREKVSTHSQKQQLSSKQQVTGINGTTKAAGSSVNHKSLGDSNIWSKPVTSTSSNNIFGSSKSKPLENNNFDGAIRANISPVSSTIESLSISEADSTVIPEVISVDNCITDTSSKYMQSTDEPIPFTNSALFAKKSDFNFVDPQSYHFDNNLATDKIISNPDEGVFDSMQLYSFMPKSVNETALPSSNKPVVTGIHNNVDIWAGNTHNFNIIMIECPKCGAKLDKIEFSAHGCWQCGFISPSENSDSLSASHAVFTNMSSSCVPGLQNSNSTQQSYLLPDETSQITSQPMYFNHQQFPSYFTPLNAANSQINENNLFSELNLMQTVSNSSAVPFISLNPSFNSYFPIIESNSISQNLWLGPNNSVVDGIHKTTSGNGLNNIFEHLLPSGHFGNEGYQESINAPIHQSIHNSHQLQPNPLGVNVSDQTYDDVVNQMSFLLSDEL